MRIGILGGSFNPIHNGHLQSAAQVLEQNLVDEIWFMPCKIHPLSKSVIDEKYRVDMVNLAISNIAQVKLCDIELQKTNTSYTYQTLRELRKSYPHEFYLIIGSDILSEITRWKGYDHLRREAIFIVFNRDGYSKENPGVNILRQFYSSDAGISSTKVRNRVKRQEPIADLVPKQVENYIKRFGLYKK
jgi:nicotinate-nucleotide adenylyltransferase